MGWVRWRSLQDRTHFDAHEVAPDIMLVPLAYHTLLLSGSHSATWGMRLFDLELRSWNGECPGFLQSLAQTAMILGVPRERQLQRYRWSLATRSRLGHSPMARLS